MLEEILDFVREMVEVNMKIEAGTPLYSSGMIDSMKHVQLISFLEDTYQVIIPISMINLENFDNVNSICIFMNGLNVQ